jgi:hypothetical protein
MLDAPEERPMVVPQNILGMMNVREFGALGNGVNDDQQAIQNAIDAAVISNSHVFLPPGKYRVDSTLYSKGVPLAGSGMDISIIEYWGNGPCINGKGPETSHRFTMRDVTLQATSESAGRNFDDYGLNLGNNHRSLGALQRVRIHNFSAYGIYFEANI